MVTVNKECFYLETFLLISGISGFPYFTIEHTVFENTETAGNFHKTIFRDIKTIYLVSSTFLRILCVQDTTHKVLLKVSLNIYCYCVKVAFLVIKPKWYLDTKLVAFQQFHSNATVSNMCFLN